MFGPIRGPWPDDSCKGRWGTNPPYHIPVFVLTNHPRASIAMEGGTTFHFVSDGIDAAFERAIGAAKGQDVRLGGGVATIRQYLRAGLIDEMHLAIAPILLGIGEHVFLVLMHLDSVIAAPKAFQRRMPRMSLSASGNSLGAMTGQSRVQLQNRTKQAYRGAADNPKAVVVANDGSHPIHLPDGDKRVPWWSGETLLSEDHVSGVFVHSKLSKSRASGTSNLKTLRSHRIPRSQSISARSIRRAANRCSICRDRRYGASARGARAAHSAAPTLEIL